LVIDRLHKLEVMTARGIADALTGDHHFAQAGFRALLLPNKEWTREKRSFVSRACDVLIDFETTYERFAIHSRFDPNAM
jgi:hypothetical protein